MASAALPGDGNDRGDGRTHQAGCGKAARPSHRRTAWAAWKGAPPAPLTRLLIAIALAALGLLLLRLLADLAWGLVNRWVDHAVERERCASDQERVQRILSAQIEVRQRQRTAAQALQARVRLTDLSGRPLLLQEDQIPAFHRLCCRELGLPASSGWAQIRSHWRRQSLRWHPDHGGDVDIWLRKNRAYEALRSLQSQRRQWLPSPLPPLLGAGRSRRWWRSNRQP